MQILRFDIWDGDKGVILAKDKDAAVALFKKQYGDRYPVEGYDTEDYDAGIARIDTVGDVTGSEMLYITEC